MLNVLLYEHLEKHWISECQWNAFFQQCTLGVLGRQCSSQVWLVLFLVSNSEALERIKAICEENDVRETQGKTDGGPIWDEVLRMGAD